jgi:hypothetical protein
MKRQMILIDDFVLKKRWPPLYFIYLQHSPDILSNGKSQHPDAGNKRQQAETAYS